MSLITDILEADSALAQVGGTLIALGLAASLVAWPISWYYRGVATEAIKAGLVQKYNPGQTEPHWGRP